MISTKFIEAKKRTRKSLIHQNRHQKSGDDPKIRRLFTHNKGNPPLHQWFREAKKCLIKDDRAKALGDNFQICYRQPTHLRSTVTHTRQPSIQEDDPGCRKCGKCSVSFPVLVEGSKFTSTNTKKSYPIRNFFNCDSSYLIYLATCTQCRGQYVGKSQTPFKKRHSNHKQETRKHYGGLDAGTNTSQCNLLTRWRRGTKWHWQKKRRIGRTNCAVICKMGAVPTVPGKKHNFQGVENPPHPFLNSVSLIFT